MGRFFKGLLLGLLLLPAAAGAAGYSGMYVFGDSLSDNGNIYGFTSAWGFPYPSSPYYDGRFSNGPVAAEHVADTLIPGGSTGSNFYDFAWGGATSGVGNVGDGGTPTSAGIAGLPGLTTEVGAYYSALSGASADPNALYMVWAGPNDFLDGGYTDYAASVNNVKFAVQVLASLGAKQILVPNMVDLSLTPRLQATGDAARIQQAHDLSLAFDSLLASTLTDLNTQLGALGTHVHSFDTLGIFNQVMADPNAFGLTNVSTPCYDEATGAVCANPDQYLFWDSVHPTAQGHLLLGQRMAASVVPEPATVLLMVAGLLFIGLQVRRNRA